MCVGGCTHDPERHDEMDVEHGLELLVGGLLDDAVPAVAGIVDDDVESAEAIESGGDEGVGERGFGEIAGDGGNLPAAAGERPLRLGQGRLFQIVQQHRRARVRELGRDGAADAAAGAGDQGSLAFEREAHARVRSFRG